MSHGQDTGTPDPSSHTSPTTASTPKPTAPLAADSSTAQPKQGRRKKRAANAANTQPDNPAASETNNDVQGDPEPPSTNTPGAKRSKQSDEAPQAAASQSPATGTALPTVTSLPTGTALLNVVESLTSVPVESLFNPFHPAQNISPPTGSLALPPSAATPSFTSDSQQAVLSQLALLQQSMASVASTFAQMQQSQAITNASFQNQLNKLFSSLPSTDRPAAAPASGLPAALGLPQEIRPSESVSGVGSAAAATSSSLHIGGSQAAAAAASSTSSGAEPDALAKCARAKVPVTSLSQVADVKRLAGWMKDSSSIGSKLSAAIKHISRYCLHPSKAAKLRIVDALFTVSDADDRQRVVKELGTVMSTLRHTYTRDVYEAWRTKGRPQLADLQLQDNANKLVKFALKQEPTDHETASALRLIELWLVAEKKPIELIPTDIEFSDDGTAIVNYKKDPVPARFRAAKQQDDNE